MFSISLMHLFSHNKWFQNEDNKTCFIQWTDQMVVGKKKQDDKE